MNWMSCGGAKSRGEIHGHNVRPGYCSAREDLGSSLQKGIFRLIPYLFVCYLFNYLDRVNVGFAKLQMLDDLHMSETVYGLGAASFLLVILHSASQAT